MAKYLYVEIFHHQNAYADAMLGAKANHNRRIMRIPLTPEQAKIFDNLQDGETVGVLCVQED